MVRRTQAAQSVRFKKNIARNNKNKENFSARSHNNAFTEAHFNTRAVRKED